MYTSCGQPVYACGRLGARRCRKHTPRYPDPNDWTITEQKPDGQPEIR